MTPKTKEERIKLARRADRRARYWDMILEAELNVLLARVPISDEYPTLRAAVDDPEIEQIHHDQFYRELRLLRATVFEIITTRREPTWRTRLEALEVAEHRQGVIELEGKIYDTVDAFRDFAKRGHALCGGLARADEWRLQNHD